MTSTTAHNAVDPSVSLPLQSLIDERKVSVYSAHTDMQGLSSLTGQMLSRRRGNGLEFEDLRTYAPGDDIRHIDWKVSARHNQLYTRLFREEKEQHVTLALDFTAPMFTGSVELKAIQAGRMAANIAWHMVSAGGRCGLLIQTDRGFHAVQPTLGDRAALAICAEIARQFDIAKLDAQEFSNTTDHNKQNNITLLDRLQQSGRGTGAIVVLAGLNHTDTAFTHKLNELHVAKQLAVLNIEDPMEYTPLPTGFFRYKSANGNASISVHKKQTAELKLALENQNRQLVETFTAAQVPLLQSRIGIIKVKSALKALGFLA